MNKVFKSENLIYKPVELTDSKLILKWRNSPEIKKNFIIQEDITEEENRNWFENYVSKGKSVQFIIITKVGNAPIGSVYYSHINDEKKSAEYGIFLGENEAVGRGFGKEVVKWAVNYAFTEMGMLYLYLRVFEDNVPAIKSYIYGGFEITNKYEIIKQNGQDRKLIYMENINAK